jgi:hypothetical protein
MIIREISITLKPVGASLISYYNIHPQTYYLFVISRPNNFPFIFPGFSVIEQRLIGKKINQKTNKEMTSLYTERYNLIVD